uniref:Secreted protein n=1 Tax=Octopus bimaculoides TaxID=37653 RepID=A0A0L8HXH1_OCTBM
MRWRLSWMLLPGTAHVCALSTSLSMTSTNLSAITLAKIFKSALSRVMGLKLSIKFPSFGSFFSNVTAPRLTKPGILPFCCQLQ